MGEGRIHTLLTDLERLLLVYRVPIIQGALHVYWSALVTMPSCLLLAETAPYDGHGIPLMVTKRAPGWGLREKILEVLGNVTHIAYSPNGNLIASVGGSVSVQVWDVATGTTLHRMSIPDTEAANKSWECTTISVAFSPNSQWIVSGGRDCTVRLWNVVTGSQHHVMTGHTGPISCVAFSPNGTAIVSGSYDGTLRLWDRDTSTERLVFVGHTKSVNSLVFEPNHGHYVVSASSDGTLRVWDTLTGTELRVIGGDGGDLYCVAFSPDGSTIASGSSIGTLQLWCATTSTRKLALKVLIDSDRSLAFSPDSRSIVSCDGNGLAQIWDVTTGIEKRRLTENVHTVAYSPDGKSISFSSPPRFFSRFMSLFSSSPHTTAHTHSNADIPLPYYPLFASLRGQSVELTPLMWRHDQSHSLTCK
jgi:WD40 repeat protein